MRSRLGTMTAVTLLAAGRAFAQEGGEAPAGCMGSGGITGLLPILAMVAIFYFLIIRPQQKQAKKLSAMRQSLKKGDRVVSGGGIHGVITNLKGDIVTVRIADSVKVDMDRNSLTLIESDGEENTE